MPIVEDYFDLAPVNLEMLDDFTFLLLHVLDLSWGWLFFGLGSNCLFLASTLRNYSFGFWFRCFFLAGFSRWRFGSSQLELGCCLGGLRGLLSSANVSWWFS